MNPYLIFFLITFTLWSILFLVEKRHRSSQAKQKKAESGATSAAQPSKPEKVKGNPMPWWGWLILTGFMLPPAVMFTVLATMAPKNGVAASTSQDPLRIEYPCTYCYNGICYPAKASTPGQADIINPQYGTGAHFNWKINGRGLWSQPYPEDFGEIEWRVQKYYLGILQGVERSNAKPQGDVPVTLSCQGPIPYPNF
jgi:hypothetical protein